jgi:hypothetical protein
VLGEPLVQFSLLRDQLLACGDSLLFHRMQRYAELRGYR